MIYVEVIALGMRAGMEEPAKLFVKQFLLTTRAFFAFLAVTRARVSHERGKKVSRSN
jgi:hypothetical protein